MIIFTVVNKNIYKSNICLFKEYKNFILFYDYDDDDYYYEYKQFKDCYIRYSYHYTNLSSITYFNYSGERHREDGPAYIQYDKNGGIDYKSYYLNGKIYSYEDYLLKIKK